MLRRGYLPPPPSPVAGGSKPAPPKRYSVTASRKRRERPAATSSDDDDIRGTLLQASRLLENNQALATEIAGLRRGNEQKLRRINALTRDLLSLRLSVVKHSHTVATQTTQDNVRDDEPTRRSSALEPSPEPSVVYSRSRRNLRRISYTEPSLKKKMRQPR